MSFSQAAVMWDAAVDSDEHRTEKEREAVIEEMMCSD